MKLLIMAIVANLFAGSAFGQSKPDTIGAEIPEATIGMLAARDRRIAKGTAVVRKATVEPAKIEPSKWIAKYEYTSRNRWGWRSRRNYWVDQHGTKTYNNPNVRARSCRGSTWGWIRRRR